MLTKLLLKLLDLYPVRKTLFLPLKRQLARFEAATRRPQEVQERLLRRILRSQSETGFGRDHGFDSIRTTGDFRRQVPIAGYERFEPYIARMRQGELNALVADPVVHMFALTSGTTAARKYIPVTRQYLADYRRGWQMWGLKTFLTHPEVRFRPIVQLTSDWEEFHTAGGVPCGSITGLTAAMQKRWVRWMYCVPACTARIKNAAAKHYMALRLSMPRRVGMVIAANPSTLVSLARAADQEKESLIRDIHDGTLSPRLAIPAEVRAAVASALRPDPDRAHELEAIIRRNGTLYPKDFWSARPFLVGTWTGGSVRAYLRHFPQYFGDAPVRDIGLLASEGRMTIPLTDGTPSGVLDVTSHYFEFIPEEDGDAKQPTVLAAHEVEEGRNYFLVPTTAFGLYRYAIHDLVRITGFHHRTPLVEFLSKGAHFSSITGEKLSEYQVTQAMEQVTQEL
ncbi:MAG TPA: GH3 auxin-responsive promoter family protein, partial [Gemmataceae bacterium]|nr:GH3 auxin-responsive promoter family protein [Gemmataceae bacterium]